MAASSSTSVGGELSTSTVNTYSVDSDSENETAENTDSTSGPSSTQVVSLLSRLRLPTASDLGRKRKTASNPPNGKRRSRGAGVNEPKNIHPSQRVRE